MKRRRRLAWRVWLPLIALGSVAGRADASDGGASTGTQPTLNPNLEISRLYAGSDASAPGHFNNYSPFAINYGDCVEGIDFEFTLQVQNLSLVPNDEIQVWAGAGSADCTETSARSSGGSGSPEEFPGRCWPVAPPGTFSTSGSSTSARLHVRDLVAYIGKSSDSIPITYSPTTSNSVCQPTGTLGAVPLGIYFILVPQGSGSGGDAGLGAAQPPDGVSGLYQTPAALIGPYAPANVQLPNGSITPTSLTVTWSPLSESVIQGFNVYVVDQGLNGVNATAASVDAGPTFNQAGIYCREKLTCSSRGTLDAGHDSGHDADVSDAKRADASHDAAGNDAGKADATAHDATLSDGASKDSGKDASVSCEAGYTDAFVQVDAATYSGESASQLAEAGCELRQSTSSQNPGSQTGTPWCYSPALQNTFTIDAGVGSVATTTSDASLATTALTLSDGGTDSATSGDTGATAISSSSTATVNAAEVAGISTINLAPYFVPGATSGSYTVNSLTTGHQYAIAVAAVDSYGNVGPIGVAPAPAQGGQGIAACSTPTAVNDFFNAYGTDGGQAGGGLCSVNAPGASRPFFASIFVGSLFAAGIARGRRRRQQRKKS